MEVLQADGGIKRLLHHESRNLLVVITEGMVLGQFSVAIDGAVTEINKVKEHWCSVQFSSSRDKYMAGIILDLIIVKFKCFFFFTKVTDYKGIFVEVIL